MYYSPRGRKESDTTEQLTELIDWVDYTQQKFVSQGHRSGKSVSRL